MFFIIACLSYADIFQRLSYRSDFENEHVIGRLTPNLWIATICEQIWIVNITNLMKGLKITNSDFDKVFYQILQNIFSLLL